MPSLHGCSIWLTALALLSASCGNPDTPREGRQVGSDSAAAQSSVQTPAAGAGGNSDCAHFCNQLPPSSERGMCVSEATRGAGLCAACAANVDLLCGGGGQHFCCAAGTACCGASCADLQTDPANCGGCGNVCAGSQVCASGKCINPVATLTGETFTGAVDVQGACVFDGAGHATFSFTATGAAAGPYIGTFVESGTIVQTFSPAIVQQEFTIGLARLSFNLSEGPLSTLNASFEIRSPSGQPLVTGTKQVLLSGVSQCTDTYTASIAGGPQSTGAGVFRVVEASPGALSYQARILTPAGAFTDRGTADLHLRRFLAPAVSFDLNNFSESFVSSLGAAQPP